MHGNQHSQHPKKLKKKQETRKQVSQWMAEDSRVKEKSSWYVKKTEEKGKRRCLDWEVDCCSIWSNIKAVVEEHLSSENVILLDT